MFKTIRGKVAIWSIIIVGILNIILSVFIYCTINLKLEKSIIDDMDTIKFIAKNSAKINVNLDDDEEKRREYSKLIIDDLYNIFNDYITIFYEENQLLNSRGNPLKEKKVEEILRESDNKKSLLKLSKEKNSYIITFNYPIYIDGSFCGNIIIQRDYTKEYKENYNIILSIFFGQAIILIILIIALWIIISKFTKPLKKLSAAIEGFAKGKNQDDIKVSSHDEVSILSDKFNFMKNEIKEQMDIIKSEQSKNRDFFNNATHELKTPITAISGYAQLLLENDILDMNEEFRDRALIRMVKESDKLNSLVKNILEISRGEANIKGSKNELDLGEIVKRKIEDFNIRLIKSNIKIEYKISSAIIKCNKEEIETIIINLIDNAIKYNSKDIIKIYVYQDEYKAVFEIRNNCYEIPKDIEDNLLKPFVKHNNDIIMEKTGITSSGLGLYICNNLTESNNGELSYKLEKNMIIFKVKIPTMDVF